MSKIQIPSKVFNPLQRKKLSNFGTTSNDGTLINNTSTFLCNNTRYYNVGNNASISGGNGEVNLNCGNVTGYGIIANLMMDDKSDLFPTEYDLTFKSVVYFSETTYNFEGQTGLHQSLSQMDKYDTNNGIVFACRHDTNGGRWLAVTCNSGTATTSDTGVDGGDYTQKTFRIERSKDLSKVDFYINDILVASHTTNIPLSSITLYPINKVYCFSNTGLTTPLFKFNLLECERGA